MALGIQNRLFQYQSGSQHNPRLHWIVLRQVAHKSRPISLTFFCIFAIPREFENRKHPSSLPEFQRNKPQDTHGRCMIQLVGRAHTIDEHTTSHKGTRGIISSQDKTGEAKHARKKYFWASNRGFFFVFVFFLKTIQMRQLQFKGL